jgi:hypothetical protein
MLLFTDRTFERLLIGLPLIIAGLIVAQCPCKRLPYCKLELFLSLIALSILLVGMQTLK